MLICSLMRMIKIELWYLIANTYTCTVTCTFKMNSPGVLPLRDYFPYTIPVFTFDNLISINFNTHLATVYPKQLDINMRKTTLPLTYIGYAKHLNAYKYVYAGGKIKLKILLLLVEKDDKITYLLFPNTTKVARIKYTLRIIRKKDKYKRVKSDIHIISSCRRIRRLFTIKYQARCDDYRYVKAKIRN